MARVLLRNVTKQYGKIVAVDGLSLEARDGEFLVLLGPSGCGKSTVLRLIAGLETLTSGDIYIGERLVNRVPTHDRNAVMMFESPTYALYPHMTAYNNVAFGLRIQEQRRGGQQTEEPGSSMGKEVLPGNNRNKRDVKEEREGIIRKRIEQAATRLGLQGHLGRKPSELSAGQQQSVALERAMLRTPEVFLMDDPLSNLDRLLHAASRAELRDLHRQLNATTIYVTHDQMDAMSLAQRIAVMKDGVLQQLGVPQAVYERPANTFVATFVGSPPMNLLPVHLEEDGGQLFAQAACTAPLRAAPRGDQCTGAARYQATEHSGVALRR